MINFATSIELVTKLAHSSPPQAVGAFWEIEVKLRPTFRPWKVRFDKLAKPIQIGIELALVVITAGISTAISRVVS